MKHQVWIENLLSKTQNIIMEGVFFDDSNGFLYVDNNKLSTIIKFYIDNIYSGGIKYILENCGRIGYLKTVASKNIETYEYLSYINYIDIKKIVPLNKDKSKSSTYGISEDGLYVFRILPFEGIDICFACYDWYKTNMDFRGIYGYGVSFFGKDVQKELYSKIKNIYLIIMV